MTSGGSVGHKSTELPLIRGSCADPQDMSFSVNKANLQRLSKYYEKKYNKNIFRSTKSDILLLYFV
jgi:hypothetical protein